MEKVIQIGVLVLLLSVWSLAFAEDGIYTWTDEQGQVHYSDEPPQNGAANSVTLNAKPVRVKPPEQVYTWTDEQGAVYYGERPPADQQAEPVDMDSQSMSTIQGTEFRPGERALLRELEEDGR